MSSDPTPQLILDIAVWVAVNENRIMKAYKQKADWESWIHVELASYLAPAAVRQLTVYANGNRADIVIRSDRRPLQIIEVKCQSNFLDVLNTTPDHFARRFQSAVFKIHNNLNNELRPAEQYVVGITCTAPISRVTASFNYGNLPKPVYWDKVENTSLVIHWYMR
jgi:hypothetical protein